MQVVLPLKICNGARQEVVVAGVTHRRLRKKRLVDVPVEVGHHGMAGLGDIRVRNPAVIER